MLNHVLLDYIKLERGVTGATGLLDKDIALLLRIESGEHSFTSAELRRLRDRCVSALRDRCIPESNRTVLRTVIEELTRCLE